MVRASENDRAVRAFPILPAQSELEGSSPMADVSITDRIGDILADHFAKLVAATVRR